MLADGDCERVALPRIDDAAGALNASEIASVDVHLYDALRMSYIQCAT